MENTTTNPVQGTEPSSPAPAGGARNTFLTVLCILTFVGSGWGVIKAIRSYATANAVAAVAGSALKTAQDQMDQQKDTPNIAKDIMSSVSQGVSADNIRKMSILQLISNILTLTGAIMMWTLRKTGFYLYIAGIVVLIFAPIVMGTLIGIVGGIVIGIIGVAFIVMYGINLKSMNRTPAAPAQ